MGILGKNGAEAFSKSNKETSLKDKKKEKTRYKKPSNKLKEMSLIKEFIYRCLFDMNYSDKKAAFVLRIDVELVKALRAHGRI